MKSLLVLPIVLLVSTLAHAGNKVVECQGILTQTNADGSARSSAGTFYVTTTEADPTSASIFSDGTTIDTKIVSKPGALQTFQHQDASGDANFELSFTRVQGQDSESGATFMGVNNQRLDKDMKPNEAPWTGVMSCMDKSK